MRKFATICALIATVLAASLGHAQDSENGVILSWIEDSISTPDRIIRIRDVQGALNSSAQIGQITIADSAGVWLQIDGAQIDWRRAALFRGTLEIHDLRAERIHVLRQPVPAQAAPTAEAADLHLPELPVDIHIDNVSSDAVILGEDVIGLGASLTVQGALQFDTAGLDAQFAATRTDGPGGQISVAVRYARATTWFDIEATIQEPAGGVIVTAMNLDARPALDARLSGHGVLDDLSIDLAVDVGRQRLISGNLSLGADPAGRRIRADLNGEIAALVPDDYRSFFAGNSQITAHGLLRMAGGVTLGRLRITTAELRAEGSFETTDDGFPRRADMAITIARANAMPVILPFGSDISVGRADLRLGYGLAQDGSYALTFTAQDLQVPGYQISQIDGRMAGQAAGLEIPDARQVEGKITITASDIATDSADVAAALGDKITFDADWNWAAGHALTLESATIGALAAEASAQGVFAGLDFDGYLAARITDLRAFSGLAGRALGGQVSVFAQGQLPVLGGQFDLNLGLNGQDISIDQPQLDALLAGASQISGHIRRDETGVTITNGTVTAPLITANVNATLDSRNIGLNAVADISDLSPILPQLPGGTAEQATVRAAVRLAANGALDAIAIDAEMRTDNGVSASVAGVVGTEMALDMRFQNLPLDAVATVAPQYGLGGAASGALQISGRQDDPRLDFDIQLADLQAAVLTQYNVPRLSIDATGTATTDMLSVQAARILGAGGLDVLLSGQAPLSLRGLDLRASGAAPLALGQAFLDASGITLTGIARFELGLSGAIDAPIVQGQISTRDARLFAPQWRAQLDNIELRAILGANAIRFEQAAADFQGGGRVRLGGEIGLGSGFPAALELVLSGIQYGDGRLYSTIFDGALTLDGPLTRAPQLAGQIDLRQTEIQVPSGSTIGADLPEITHINVPRPVRRSQERAGVVTTATSGPAVNLGLDLVIRSNGRVFLRGRGLDAELGGAVRISGSTADLRATGQFDLLRGRMDLLGQRLDFTRGNARLIGSIEPIIDLQAQTRSDDLTIYLQLVGPATAPEIVLSSTPDLPQDEILARLIFNRGLDSLSAFQIAQLASGLAELSGRSNGGLIDQLRRAAGLDNLDIRTAGGETSVAAGGYLRENVYSEVELGTSGTTNFSVNLDIIDGLKARATVGSDGETGLGVFFQRDY